MDFWYADGGDEFDIRDFSEEMRGGATRDDIMRGDRESNKIAIRHSVDAGLPLRRAA